MSGKRNATAKPVSGFSVLYDGWPLAHAPGSPAAIHLLEIISALPEGITPWAALPFAEDVEQARGLFGSLPVLSAEGAGVDSEAKGIRPVFAPAADTPAGRLRWQQWTLPRLACRVGARHIHTTGARPPLFSSVPVIVSPTGPLEGAPAAETFAGHLGEALGRGGLRGARAVLWPADLPELPGGDPLFRQSPFVHQAFHADQDWPESSPESYVLAAGSLDGLSLEELASAWSWAQAGLGEDWALLASDLDEAGLERLRELCREAGITGRIERWTASAPEQRAALFQHAGAVLVLGQVTPWADALLQALASGRPLVAEESLLADARTGPAAYLVPKGDARGLGAALITVIVEETVGEQLARAARVRAAGWLPGAFTQALAAVYGIKNDGNQP